MKLVEVVDLTDDAPIPTPAQEPPVEEEVSRVASCFTGRAVLWDTTLCRNNSSTLSLNHSRTTLGGLVAE
jgi:hypothetical protein